MSHSAEIAKLLNLIDRLMNETDEEREARFKVELERARQRQYTKNERFRAALAKATDIQAARIANLELNGMRVVKLWQKRGGNRIAVMLQKEGVFDTIKMKMGTKLTMVYPDGVHFDAFGKISIDESRF